MASALQSQLQARAAAQGLPALQPVKGTPSLLWEYQRAGDIDLQSIYELAITGLQELCALDARFIPFQESLFSHSNLSFVRESQPPDVLAKLNESVRRYLLLLSDFFLSPSAFKTLEFLLRRFRVNLHNVDDLLRCALPYHATTEFVRLMQVLSLKRADGRGRWAWLWPVQDSGAPVPREVIVLRCINDTAMFKFICDTAGEVGNGRGSGGSTFITFYAAVLTELCASAPITPALLQQLLPNLLAGVGATATDDLRSATLMALAQLSDRVQLSKPFLEVMVTKAVTNASPSGDGVPTMLLALSCLAATQEQLTRIQHKALKVLVSPPLLDALSALWSRHSRKALAVPLLHLIVQSLAQSLPLQPALCAKQLTALLSRLPAGALTAVAGDLAADLLDLANAHVLDAAGRQTAVAGAASVEGLPQEEGVSGSGRDTAAIRTAVQQVLRALELRYPGPVDDAVHSALQDPNYTVRFCSIKHSVNGLRQLSLTLAPSSGGGGGAGRAQLTSDADDQEMDDATEAAAAQPPQEQHATAALFDFMTETFQLTASAPLGARASGGGDGDEAAMHTLASALDAPSAALRSTALQRLQEVHDQCAAACNSLASGDNEDEPVRQRLARLRSQLDQAVVRHLADEDWAVVLAAVSLPGLPQLPPAQLAAALQLLQSRLAAVLLAKDKSPHLKVVTKTAEKVVAAQALLAQRHPEYLDRALLSLLAWVVPARRLNVRLSHSAVQALATLHHPLLAPAALAQVSGDAGATGTPQTNGKKSKKAAAAAAASAPDEPPAEPSDAAPAPELQLLQKVVTAISDALSHDVGLVHVVSGLISASHRMEVELGSSAGERVRLLLLLALQHAATAGSEELQGNPGASGAGGKLVKAKKAGGASANGARSGSAAGEAADALMTLGLSELQRPGTTVLPDWQAVAADCIDAASGLPSLEMLSHLCSTATALQSLCSVMWCSALLLAIGCSALPHPPGASLGGGGGAGDLASSRFAALAQLQPADVFAPHVTAWLRRCTPPGHTRLAFLASFYASASSLRPVAAASLCLLAFELPAITGSSGVSGSSTSAALGAEQHALQWVPHVLWALQRPEQIVRLAAVRCLEVQAGMLAAASGTVRVDGTSVDVKDWTSLLQAILAHRALLVADANAVAVLLRGARERHSGAPETGGAAQAAPLGSSKTPKKKKGGATAAPDLSSAHLAVDDATLRGALRFLCASLERLHPETSEADACAAFAALALVMPLLGTDLGADVALPAVALLQRLLQQQVAALAPVQVHLAALVLTMLATSAEEQLPQLTVDQLRFLVDVVAPPSDADADVAVLRVYGLRLLPRLFGRLSPALQAAALQHVLQDIAHTSSSSNGAEQLSAAPLWTEAAGQALVLPPLEHGDLRSAARVALQALPLSESLLVPTFQAAAAFVTAAAPQANGHTPLSKSGTPSKRSKTKPSRATATRTDVDTPVMEAGSPSGAQAMDTAVMLLEVLQTRSDIQGVSRLLAALQHLLAALLPALSPITQPHDESEGADLAGNDEAVARATATASAATAPGGASMVTGYAAQLTVSALHALADRCTGGGAGGEGLALADFDFKLIVSCAQAAQDGVLRNAAFGLLTLLSGSPPKEVLEHVLQVLALVNTTSAGNSDSHSLSVASGVLSALVPAWLSAGRPAEALWSAVVDMLPSVPHTRHLRMLQMLLAAMPKDNKSIEVGLLLLLNMAVAGSVPPASGPPAESAVELPAEWAPDLAAKLLQQVSPSERLTCLAQLISLAASADDGSPSLPLPRLVIAFATAQVKAKAVLSVATTTPAAKVVGGATAATSDATAATATEQEVLQAGCSMLMRQVLEQLQLLHASPPAGGTDAEAVDGPSAQLRATAAAADGLHQLLTALQGIMDDHAFVKALVELSQQPSDQVRRRALRLLTNKLRDLRSKHTSRARVTPTSKSPAGADDGALAAAALALCTLLPQLLQLSDVTTNGPASGDIPAPGGAKGKRSKAKAAGGTPASAAPASGGPSRFTRQAALVAVSEAVACFGATLPEVVLAALPSVLSCVQDEHPAIRGSSLATVAVMARACGTKLLPHLPIVVAAVFKAANNARKRLAKLRKAAGATATVPAAAVEGAAAALLPLSAVPVVTEVASDEEEEEEAQKRAGSGIAVGTAVSGSLEEVATVVAGSLAALGALLESLNAFLSPYVPVILQIVLAPEVLSCDTAHVSAYAGAIRSRLASALPVRLLLGPMTAALQPSFQAGIGPLTALLDLASVVNSGLDARAAAMHREQLFDLLLRALDVRRQVPQSSEDDLHEAEAAAVSALVSLVMKLNEASFKPLFLRLLEWAAKAPTDQEGDVAGSAQSRLITLMAVCCALTERLRSVFVPYFRYLMDIIVHTLDATATGSGRPKKKLKAQLPAPPGALPAAHGEHPAGGALGDGGPAVVQQWTLRLQVLRALCLCFTHDSVGFVDLDHFQRLMPLLVAQLHHEVPAAVADVLDRQFHAWLTANPSTAAGALGSSSAAAAAVAGRRDVFGSVVSDSVVLLAVAAGSDAAWKPLNHQVLMATRSSSSRCRLLALRTLSSLVGRLREEYLTLLPEALPFLAELMEDADGGVEAACQALLVTLEELSGEKLDQYLK